MAISARKYRNKIVEGPINLAKPSIDSCSAYPSVL